MNGVHKPKGTRTWIELSDTALRKNHRVLRSLIPRETKLMMVVKSNAYGHGPVETARRQEKSGANWLGVDTAEEGFSLREAGIRIPILILGYTVPELFKKCASSSLSVSIASFTQLKHIHALKTSRPPIHIKVDTGFNRRGFLEPDIKKLLTALAKKKISVEGVFTHFASADEPHNRAQTRLQLKEFKIWVRAFKDGGFQPLFHASGSAGTLLFPEAHFDMVRVGILQYGLWPSTEMKHFLDGKIKLIPVLTWRTIASEVKNIPKGSLIGYGFTERVSKSATIAICPIGYWHGYSRALSSMGYALVHGKRAKVLGRVSMDMIAIDITGIRAVREGSVVTLIGKDQKVTISADELAKLSDTINYEIVTRLNPLIKRIWI